NIMRDNMIICLSDLGPGHCMAMDLNIEHLIEYLKTLLQAKGMTSTWDSLGNISACILHLQLVKKKICDSLNGSYRNSGHTTPDTSHLVWHVANKIGTEILQQLRSDWPHNERKKLIKDIQLRGEELLKSSTLGTINKKI
ncbi:hypothetical protein C8R43DRAFT_875826, partial [Mycena crocata]